MLRTAWEFFEMTAQRFWKVWGGMTASLCFIVFMSSSTKLYYVLAVETCALVVLFAQGFEQYKRLIPRLIMRNLRAQESHAEDGRPETTYYFELFNDSTNALESVVAEVTSVKPKVRGLHLPLPLASTSEGSTINPRTEKQFKFVSQEFEGPAMITKDHDAGQPLPKGAHRLTVRAASKTTAMPIERVFEVTAHEEYGLRCIEL